MAKATFRIATEGLSPVFKEALGDMGAEMLDRDLNIKDSGVKTNSIIQGWGIQTDQYGREELVIEVELVLQ